ncbi:Calcium-transporting ATPase 12, plasma membrane-type [Linum perenne]
MNSDFPSSPGKAFLSIRAHKRWRLAYSAIRSIRAMLSLVREIVIVHHPLPYSLLQIEPTESTSYLKPTIKSLDPTKLAEMVKEKDKVSLRSLGGVRGIAASLGTDDSMSGVSSSNVEKRKEMFGSNTYPKAPSKGLISFMLEAVNDTTILILLACAALSLGFGIKQDGLKEGWYEGGSIIVAVMLVVIISALSNYRQGRQFEKLSKIGNDIGVEVVRDGGRRQKVSIFDVVVGDIVCLKIGDQIPADGLFLDGHSLQIDESSMTGESDHVEVDSVENPFMFSGCKVANGYGRMVVTAVGMNTSWGEMMGSISKHEEESTPLQARLNKLTSSIGKVGLAVAFVVLVVMLVRYFTGHTTKDRFVAGKTKTGDVMDAVVRIVAAAVTIVVVAIPEGLPLAVTLTLAYSMKRMMADQSMVRKLSACETMGSATVVCTDKTGTLTLNQMKVTKLSLGLQLIDQVQVAFSTTSSVAAELLKQGIGLNTTGSVFKGASDSKPEISGSPTEKAILSWGVTELGMDMEDLTKSFDVLQVETFNSEKKRSGVCVKTRVNDGMTVVHWKGAAEMIVRMCSSYLEIDGTVKSLDDGGESRSRVDNIIQGMAASSLRCIAFGYKEVTIVGMPEDGLTLLGIVGLKDPCRPGAKEAVELCRSAGVQVKMITGDNVFTARAIATECGILNMDYDHQSVVEGSEFRNYSHEERMERVDRILVMARSSPFDKLLMVQCLKQKGHVVAVTGDGTNDAPAMKEADVGLSMGIQGTEVAKESSDIVILDDNFASVTTVLKWGRCVYNNIQKFIQFQLTVNVAALVINFIAAVSSGEVPLTAVQLLWVNLIMDTLGALALATDRPTDELMKSPPVGRSQPLITNIMWRNLMAQAAYQVTVLLVLEFEGESIFNVTSEVKNTLVFNTFVMCQVFNEFNSRKLEKMNVFEGVLKNRLFVGIIGVTIVLQVVMVEFLGKFADTERLNGLEWGVCILIAAVSWPIGFCVKLVPVPQKPFFSYLKSPSSMFKKMFASDRRKPLSSSATSSV